MWGGVGSLTENDINGTVIYTVTFDSNGGTEIDPVKVPSGSTIEKPNEPLKEGYVFSGWFKDNETFNDPFIFGTDGDKISHDITLYAQWFEPDTLIAEYAAGEIVIGYAAGDNAKHVTQNLTLPTKIESSDITWESNSGAVSTNGTVTRQNTDTDVILTATANYNGKKSATKTFNVKVIKKRTRDNSKIEALTIANASSGDVTITRNESGDVTDIEGQYVSFDINNADDALDAVTVLRNELGIKNPEKELQLNGATINQFGEKYCFGQVYNEIPIYGRRIIVSVSTEGKANFLISDFLSSDILDNANLNAGFSQSQAEEIAKTNYSGDVTCDSVEVIYSFGDYKISPVRAWIVAISGTKNDGSMEFEDVIIKALNGEIIERTSNISYAVGENEFEREVEFPVKITQLFGDKTTYQYMVDSDLKLMIAGSPFDTYTGNPLVNARAELNTKWNDPQQVSAYINMREILTWWKEKFGRNSLYDNDEAVYVFTHVPLRKDDAAFTVLPFEGIYVFDKNEYDRSFAACRDFMAHETTHAVMYHEISTFFAKIGYSNSTRIPLYIDEAYADIFACLMTDDWQIGEDLYKDKTTFDCIRNIEEPYNQKTKFYSGGLTEEWWNKAIKLHGEDSSLWYIEAESHLVSMFISHAAYLMGKNGIISKDELQKLWYATIYKGAYNSDSKFSDVRNNILKAAKNFNFSAEKIEAIKKAFDAVGITGTSTPASTPALSSDIPINVTNFPDNYFRSYVKKKFDTDSSDTLSSSEIANATFVDVEFNETSKDFTGNGVTSLKGIEHLTSLKTLLCSNNNLTTLDLRSNVALEILDCSDNPKLTELHVETCPSLREINCSWCQLTTLDVSNKTALESLWCDESKLTSLDVENCTALYDLSVSWNKLTNLDVSTCSSLYNFSCMSNDLISVNVNGCAALQTFVCGENQLTSLNLKTNTSLSYLQCQSNDITALDLSYCQYLKPQNVHCDASVNITFNNSVYNSEITSSKNSVSFVSLEGNASNNSIILATLPTFYASQTGEKSFNVSFDRIAPKDSTLILRSGEKDLSGIFLNDDEKEITMPLTESLDHAKVFADFEQGKNYSPVIVAENKNSDSNSGCNVSMFGIVILFAGVIFARKH